MWNQMINSSLFPISGCWQFCSVYTWFIHYHFHSHLSPFAFSGFDPAKVTKIQAVPWTKSSSHWSHPRSFLSIYNWVSWALLYLHFLVIHSVGLFGNVLQFTSLSIVLSNSPGPLECTVHSGAQLYRNSVSCYAQILFSVFCTLLNNITIIAIIDLFFRSN